MEHLGQKNGRFETKGLIYGSPAIGTDGAVFVGSWDGFVYAIDGATGAQKWSFKANGPVTGSAAIGSDGVVYVGSHGKYLYALDGASRSYEVVLRSGRYGEFAFDWTRRHRLRWLLGWKGLCARWRDGKG